MEGWLYKRGRVNTSYKRRFFRLKNTCLVYYIDDNSKKPQGDILLTGATIDSDPANNEIFGFQLKSNGRTYIIRASDKEDMDWWVDKIAPILGGTSEAKETPEANETNSTGSNKTIEKLKIENEDMKAEYDQLSKRVKESEERNKALQRDGTAERLAAQEEEIKKLNTKLKDEATKRDELQQSLARSNEEKQAAIESKETAISKLNEATSALEAAKASETKAENVAEIAQKTAEAAKKALEISEKEQQSLTEDISVLKSLSMWGVSDKDIQSSQTWKVQIDTIDSKTAALLKGKQDTHMEIVIVDKNGRVLGRAARTPTDNYKSPLYITAGDKKEDVYVIAQLKWDKKKKMMQKLSTIAWGFIPIASIDFGVDRLNEMQLYKKPVDLSRDPEVISALGSQKLNLTISVS